VKSCSIWSLNLQKGSVPDTCCKERDANKQQAGKRVSQVPPSTVETQVDEQNHRQVRAGGAGCTDDEPFWLLQLTLTATGQMDSVM
jgi:hypothetical protein